MKRKAFLAKRKHQYHVFQLGEYDFIAPSEKELRLLQESMFVSFDA